MTTKIVNRLKGLGFTQYTSDNDKNIFKGFGRQSKSFVMNTKGDKIVGINVNNSQLKHVPKYISESVDLTVLYLNNNHIKDINFLNNLPKLRHVGLKNNGLKDDCGIDNLKLPKLRCLLVNKNEFTKISTDVINNNELKYLNYSDNNIEVIPESVEVSNIRYLYVSGNKIKSLKNVPFNAYKISARNNAISNESMGINLKNECPNMKQLYLSENELTDAFDVPENLSKLSIRKNNYDDCKRQLEVVEKFKEIKTTLGDLISNSLYYTNEMSKMFADLDNCDIVV